MSNNNIGPISLSNYCTVQDIRDEGFSETDYPDNRVEKYISIMSRRIEKWTGQWFYPREFKDPDFYRVDGTGHEILYLDIPICKVTSLKLDLQGLSQTSEETIELSTVRVYNRHLKGQTASPDQNHPKIEFINDTENVRFANLFGVGKWPEGIQNVKVEGYLGYTEYDPNCELGQTPPDISYACALMVARELGKLAECDKTQGRTRNRQIGHSGGKSSVKLQPDFIRGIFTGDPEIDNILVTYMRPRRIT